MSRRGLLAGLALLIVAVGLAIWAFVAAWDNAGDVELSVHGWIAMGLAFLITGALGGGLMWLAFYSSRRGWDDVDRDL